MKDIYEEIKGYITLLYISIGLYVFFVGTDPDIFKKLNFIQKIITALGKIFLWLPQIIGKWVIYLMNILEV